MSRGDQIGRRGEQHAVAALDGFEAQPDDQKKIPGQYDLGELEEDMARLYKKVALSRSP